MSCPCGRPTPYDACCGKYHAGRAQAPDPETLMRSRYSAYRKQKIDYLIATWHPGKRGALDRQALERSARATRWTGLTVLEATGGTLVETTGIVAFEARFEGGTMRERSRFEKVDGAWYYLDGEVD